MSEGFGVGRIIAHAFSIWKASCWQLMLIAAIILWPLLFFLDSSVERDADKEFASSLLQIILSPVVTGALVFNVFQHLRKREVSVRDSLQVGFSRLLFVLGVTVLATIGIALGSLFFLVPGLMLICRWFVAVPVIVVEDVGVMDALSRSSELTRGKRWTIFGITLFFIGIGLATLFLAGMAIALSGSATRWIMWIFVVALTVIEAIAQCLVYYELKVMKEGVDIEELAVVFD